MAAPPKSKPKPKWVIDLHGIREALTTRSNTAKASVIEAIQNGEMLIMRSVSDELSAAFPGLWADFNAIKPRKYFTSTMAVYAAAGSMQAAQRAIRAQINPSLQISFDNASHSRVSGIYSIYDGAFFDKTGWGIVDIPLYDHSLVGSTEPLRDYLATNRNQQSPRQGANAPRGKEERQFYRLRSALGEKLTVGDICIDGTKRTPWDQASGLLIDHHNIEMAIRAYRKAHELFFDGGHVNPVPTKARVVAAIIDEVFKSDRPDLLIAECYAALHDVTVNYPRAKKFASIS